MSPSTRIHPLAARRIRAYARDCLGYLGIAVATVPVGVVVAATGLHRHDWLVWALSAVPPVVAAGVAARAESGPAGATWGKRREGLRVMAVDGGSLPLGRAVARNVAKITVPWQLGHVVAFSAARGGFEHDVGFAVTTSILCYLVIGIGLATTAWGGRTPHDRIAGSAVAASPPVRR